MARIRSVKPEFWDDRKLARRASRDARLLYIALWNLADEHGRLNGDPQWIKGQVFSYDDDLDTAAIGRLLRELADPALGAVVMYESGGDPYLFLPKLARHQRLEPGKVKSRLPEPPLTCEPPDRPDPDPPRADSSEHRADSSEPDAGSSALLYVAGSMEHGAGSRGAARGRVRDTPTVPHELPEDFAATDAMRRWAHQTYPGLDLNFETAQFCRHYRSTGQKRKSWPVQWQKWIADSHQRASSASRASPGRSRQAETDELFDNAMRIAQAMDAQEAGNDPRGNGGDSPPDTRALPAAAH